MQTYESDERDKLEHYTTVFIYNYLLAAGASSTKNFTSLFEKFDKIVSKRINPGEKEYVNNSLSEIRKLFRGLKKLGIKIPNFTSICRNLPSESAEEILRKFSNLIQLACENNISFSSISSILNGRGIPDEKGFERIKLLIHLANDANISFSSISTILHGQGTPDEKNFQLLKKTINTLKVYWAQNQIKVGLESILAIYAQIQPNQWEEYINKLLSNINKLTSVNIDINERTLKFISRLTLLKEQKDIGEIIKKASSLLGNFLIDLKIEYDKLSEEERKPFINPEQVEQATADLFDIDIFVLKLILVVLRANKFTLVYQCKYGERSTPITINLDEESENRRSLNESIGKEDPYFEEIDFQYDLKLLLDEVTKNPQKYPDFPVEILKKPIQGIELSESEIDELGLFIKKNHSLIQFFL